MQKNAYIVSLQGLIIPTFTGQVDLFLVSQNEQLNNEHFPD